KGWDTRRSPSELCQTASQGPRERQPDLRRELNLDLQIARTAGVGDCRPTSAGPPPNRSTVLRLKRDIVRVNPWARLCGFQVEMDWHVEPNGILVLACCRAI